MPFFFFLFTLSRVVFLDSETGEDWEVQIHDSILEKCSDNDDILSIVIEKQSKEVEIVFLFLLISGSVIANR